MEIGWQNMAVIDKDDIAPLEELLFIYDDVVGDDQLKSH